MEDLGGTSSSEDEHQPPRVTRTQLDAIAPGFLTRGALETQIVSLLEDFRTTRSGWMTTHLAFYRLSSELLQKLQIACHIPSGRSALFNMQFELKALYEGMVALERKIFLVSDVGADQSNRLMFTNDLPRGHPFLEALYPLSYSNPELNLSHVSQMIR
jgi:hypothetical protein